MPHLGPARHSNPGGASRDHSSALDCTALSAALLKHASRLCTAYVHMRR